MPHETDRPTRVRWVVAALFGAAGTIAYLDRIVIANVVIELRQELDLSAWQAGWVLSSFLIGYGLMLIRLIQTYFVWWREGRNGLPGMLEEEWDATTKDQEHQL